MGGVFQTSAHGCPPSRSGLRNNPGRAAHQMEIDFYLINQWRNILLHLTGTFCGKGVLQTAGKSWVLASLLLGQWKITKEARLPSASWLPGNLLPRSFLGPGKREEKPEPELSLYLPGAERSRGGGGGGGGGGSGGGGRHWQMCWQLSVTLEQDFRGSPCVTCRNGHGRPREANAASGSPNGTTPTHAPLPRPRQEEEPETGLTRREQCYAGQAWQGWRPRLYFQLCGTGAVGLGIHERHLESPHRANEETEAQAGEVAA